MSGYYDTSQICKNGHIITRRYEGRPVHRQDFCARCGEATITQCESCHANIRGDYEVPGVFAIGDNTSPAPSFCHACGKPYPWTTRKLEAARELADELEGLSDEERTALKQTFVEMTRDTPRTELASVRFKKLLAKVRGEGITAIKSIITDIASETAKKIIFGPGP
jgi:hypothetical protein